MGVPFRSGCHRFTCGNVFFTATDPSLFLVRHIESYHAWLGLILLTVITCALPHETEIKLILQTNCPFGELVRGAKMAPLSALET